MYDVLCTNKDKINLGIHKFTRKLWSLEKNICSYIRYYRKNIKRNIISGSSVPCITYHPKTFLNVHDRRISFSRNWFVCLFMSIIENYAQFIIYI